MNSRRVDRDAGLYVGYLPAPTAHARFASIAAAVLVSLFTTLAVLLATSQGDPGRGTWDASGGRIFEGTLRVDPYPVLITTDEHGVAMEAVLVDQGKYGATPRATPFSGKHVRVRGGMIRWGGRAAIELSGVPDDVVEVAGSMRDNSAADTVSSAHTTLIGEIVDPKCYLGVMNPGHGKPHLSCAELCIRGGIPPVLLMRQSVRDAGDCVLLLTSNGSAANELVHGHIGRRVRIEGVRTPSRVPGGWDSLRAERILDL